MNDVQASIEPSSDIGPFRIRLLKRITSDMPGADPNRYAPAGEREAWCNRMGAVHVKAVNGEGLGVKPDEFHYLTLPPKGIPLAVTPMGARQLVELHVNALQESGRRTTHLRNAIRHHRDSTTEHSMCWENDRTLWAVLGEPDPVDHRPPGWFVFLWRCIRYRWSRRGCCQAPSEKKHSTDQAHSVISGPGMERVGSVTMGRAPTQIPVTRVAPPTPPPCQHVDDGSGFGHARGKCTLCGEDLGTD